jgi:hypothetical protein
MAGKNNFFIRSELKTTTNPIIKMLLYITEQLETSPKRCLICGVNLDAPSLKPRTCLNTVCEYIFEESLNSSVLTELKHFPHESLFDISLAAKALLSTRSTQIFEPFPSFFLKYNEIRDKRGNLDEIKKQQMNGMDVGKAKKVDEKNKNVAGMADIIMALPPLTQLIAGVETE